MQKDKSQNDKGCLDDENLDTPSSIEEQLIIANQGLVKSIANSLCPHLIDKDDLISVGNLGLLKAIRAYNPDRGKLSTIAYICIRQEIIGYLKKEQKHSYIPFANRKLYATNKEQLWEIIPDTLTTLEKYIIELKYQGYNLAEIKEKLNNFSRKKANQLLKSGLQKINQSNET